MLVALLNPPATSVARNDFVIDVAPLPVSPAVVGVGTAVVELEEDFAGALQATRVLPRATARTPARARNASPAVDRRVSRWWAMAHRGYRYFCRRRRQVSTRESPQGRLLFTLGLLIHEELARGLLFFGPESRSLTAPAEVALSQG
jgi:hypothetical protein